MPRRKAAAEFAQDLKAIREKHAVPLHEVQDRTKVPLDVLERFEANLLIDNQHHNRVYIRALVRSYVGVLKLDEEHTLDALDMVLEGEYKRELAVAHLGLKKPKVDPPAPKPKAAASPAAASAAVAKPAPKTPPPPAPKAPKSASPPPKPNRRVGQAAPKESEGAPPLPWAAILAGVVVLALAAAVAFWALNRGEPADADPPAAQAEEQAAVEDLPPPPPEPAAVGEAIDVRIIAQPGPVQGIRLTADADARRPYWMEPDSVRVVTVQERLIIEDQWGRFRLEVEGYAYPTAPAVRDERNRIVLTKPSVQAFLDSVSVR
ncbi:MAG: helix-turn-helix domain-containing protein [Bacteroidota bacterium]